MGKSSESTMSDVDVLVGPRRNSEGSLGDGHDNMPLAEKTTTNNTIFSLGPAPDGGWLAWAQVCAGLFCSFNSWGLVNSFGVFQQYYTSNNLILANETESRISWIGTLLGILSFLGASFFSFLLDKGLAREMAITASIVSCFSWMMLSLSTEYYQIMLTQGVLTGICSSVLFCCAISAVAPYFAERRGIALGIMATGSSFGGIIYSVTTQRLLYTVGFAWTCRVNGFILLVTGVCTGALFKPRVIPKKQHHFFAWQCFKEPAWMAYCFAMLFAFIGFYIFYDYYQSYAYTKDEHFQAYVYMTAILNVGSLMGRLIPSYLVDKIGIFNVLVPGCFMSAILSFCWIAAKNKPGIILVGIIYGVFSAPITVAPGVVAAKLTPKEHMNKLGIRVSFTFIFFGLGILFGAPFAGMIVRKHGYLGAQLYCGCAWLCSGSLFFLSRQLQQEKGKKSLFVKC